MADLPLIHGLDGATKRAVKVDATGAVVTTGTITSGTVLIQGHDGVTTRNVLVDGTGAVAVQGGPVLVQGHDGTTTQNLLVDTEGAMIPSITGRTDFIFGIANAAPSAWAVLSPGGVGWFPGSASQVRIKAGGNANDTAAGTGARSLLITGLDANWDVVTETLATTGAAQSPPTTTSFIRILTVTVASAGFYSTTGIAGTNIGDITLETTAAVYVGALLAVFGRWCVASYSVPRGYRAVLTNGAMGAGASAAFRILHRPSSNTASPAFLCLDPFIHSADTGTHRLIDMQYEFDEYTDIVVFGNSTAGPGGFLKAVIPIKLYAK